MRTTPSDVAPLVLHGRHLNVSVSTVADLTAAVGNSAVDKILVAAGVYSFTTNMCTGSAICIDRAVTIEAQVPGSVVLDGKGGRRVFEIQSGGTAELIGLVMSEKYAQNKPRRVNMQARAASPARIGSLPGASYTSPHTPHVPLTTFVSTLPSLFCEYLCPAVLPSTSPLLHL